MNWKFDFSPETSDMMGDVSMSFQSCSRLMNLRKWKWWCAWSVHGKFLGNRELQLRAAG